MRFIHRLRQPCNAGHALWSCLKIRKVNIPCGPRCQGSSLHVKDLTGPPAKLLSDERHNSTMRSCPRPADVRSVRPSLHCFIMLLSRYLYRSPFRLVRDDFSQNGIQICLQILVSVASKSCTNSSKKDEHVVCGEITTQMPL